MIFVSGSSNDSLQCARYPAILGMAKRTVKYSGGNPNALETTTQEKGAKLIS
jgi:hypothetical protein